jgi:hypothetical protein
VLNVTVTRTTRASTLTVYPAGTTRPLASNLNWIAGKTIANLVAVQVGTGGQVTFFNSAGSTDVIADLEGYFAAPSGFASGGGHVALTPARITDTRAGSGAPNAGHKLGPRGTLDVQVTGAGGVPPTGASTAILNVTVTHTTSSGNLTVWPKGASRPLASNLNWAAGVTIPNRVFAKIGTSGKVSFFNNSAGSTDVIVDVSGYFNDGTGSGRDAYFTPQSPNRIADTRLSAQTLGAGQTLTLQVSGVAGVPSDASAVILNVTATKTTAASFLTVFPSTASRPKASDLNWTAGVTIPNLTVATLGTTGAIKIFNAAGKADVVVDLLGYFSGSRPGDHLVSAFIHLGTKTITASWNFDGMTCPAGSAGDFTFADSYTGPGKAASSTDPVTATAAATSPISASPECEVTFDSEPAVFGSNDFGTLTYTKPGSPTTSNAVFGNGFAPTASTVAPDMSAPTLGEVVLLIYSTTFEVTYSEPVLCSSVVRGDYSGTFDGATESIGTAACDGGSGTPLSSSAVNVTMVSTITDTAASWTLSSHGVTDQFGAVEPGTETKSGQVAGLHLTGLTTTYAAPGGKGTITLTFNANVDCTSVDSDGSDFAVFDGAVFPQSPITLTSLRTCSGRTIVYNYVARDGVTAGDRVTATAKNGTDGDTIRYAYSFLVESPGDSFTNTSV